jgi:hypothetical protein
VKEERVERVTLSGSCSGDDVLVAERSDGSLTVAPDTSIQAIRKRAGTRPMTADEFEDQFGDLPSDGEG